MMEAAYLVLGAVVIAITAFLLGVRYAVVVEEALRGGHEDEEGF